MGEKRLFADMIGTLAHFRQQAKNPLQRGMRDSIPAGYTAINCTSRASQQIWKQFSPFYLGPVETYDGLKALKMWLIVHRARWVMHLCLPNSWKMLFPPREKGLI